MKNLKDDIVDKKEILNIVNETGEEDETIKDFKKDFPEAIMKLEEVLLNYIAENDPKILKTEFFDNKWKFLTKKLAYQYGYFNNLNDYQKPVDS